MNPISPIKVWLSLGLVISVLAIIGLITYKYNHAISRAETAEAALDTYKAVQKTLTSNQEKENANNLAAAKKKLDEAAKKSGEYLAKFDLANGDRNQLSKKVSVLNEQINQNENVAIRNRSNLNDSLRLSASRDSTAASQKSSAASQLSAADSDAATLRQACRLTTIDLVKAYDIIEADTLACGREK